MATPSAAMPAARAVAGAAVLLLLLVSSVPAEAKGWKRGRATYYGNEPWLWSIHYGSCGYYYQWPDKSTGWDVAGLSDRHPEYRGSCGGCYEVKCKGNSSFVDGYGQFLDRKSSCKDPSASLIVKVSDTCPCTYPNNYYSNKRWCCGDMDHFDISVWAFEKLANVKWGVIPIQYRRVACDSKPAKKAAPVAMPFPGEFPPLRQANQRPDSFYYRYFPRGGYLNTKAGDGSGRISVDEFLKKAKAFRAGKKNNTKNNKAKTTQEGGKRNQPKPASSSSKSAPAPAVQQSRGGGDYTPWNLFGLFGR